MKFSNVTWQLKASARALANIPIALIAMAAIGLANSALMLTREILVSDVIDEDEVRTGQLVD